MRIISGKYKGKRLVAPNNLPVRPTMDMHKEALFNIINNYYDFDNLSVLDLFTGIGSIALEFGSRGTPKIVAVDQNDGCIKFLNNTNIEMGLPIEVIQADVFSFLKNNPQPFDLIFADPPYQLEVLDFEKIHTLVFENQWLTSVGMLILEHDKHKDFSHLPYFSFAKKYGGTSFSFFEI